MQLWLASSSPRRRQLLTQIGVDYQVVESTVDETAALARMEPDAARSAAAVVVELASAKAEEVARRAGTPVDACVLAADTVVVIGDEILGKPGTAAAAGAMLESLAGRTHSVYTGVAVVRRRDLRRVTGVAVTAVTLKPVDAAEISRYVATGEPLDKAGAYAVQGRGAIFVERIEGCYFNVVGLPLALTARLLADVGFDVTVAWSG